MGNELMNDHCNEADTDECVGEHEFKDVCTNTFVRLLTTISIYIYMVMFT